MTQNTNDLLLDIQDLHISAFFEDEWYEIVKGINLSLKKGEVLGLIGESGAGKSTIGLAAMGYTRDGCKITKGKVLFDGLDFAQANQKERRALRTVRIAYVAQSAASSFNPAHKIIDQHCEGPIQQGAMKRKEAEANALDLYERLHLPHADTIGFRYPHQVSGGQLQRAMTAMAMACKPDLIIFDEPTTALDVTTQIEVLAAVREVVNEFNCSAIYITHDLAVVAQMAHRIMVLKHGSLVEEAPTREMLSAPKEDYTKSLWSVRTLQSEVRRVTPNEVPVVEVDNIVAGYGNVQILNNVSMKVYKGRTLAVIGESGSGKSTTARVITGLLEPSQGRILFDGQEVASDYRKRHKDDLRKVQMIYQIPDTALNPRQKIKDIIGRPVEFYLGLKGKAKEAHVRELLEMIELDPDKFMMREPRELSGGQKQRIGIARALAAEPELIICDEVTSALDQLVAAGILKLLRRLQDQMGLAYLFITHDVATVRAIADEVVVMRQGNIIEQGLRDDMFTPPHHEYTELLLSSEPEMDPDWLNRVLHERKLDAETSY
ncbi:ABC transporter ATP-binding protein [Terasakiella pusilla]|uniref:ABC transporter ATP-binding protein n=1 Tax=Terasakiella pusilla TaxID=64973 RepID=UPI00049131B5|nr:ABC transporter ATP-binding protein [Terasakiella pusilla]